MPEENGIIKVILKLRGRGNKDPQGVKIPVKGVWNCKGSLELDLGGPGESGWWRTTGGG